MSSRVTRSAARLQQEDADSPIDPPNLSSKKRKANPPADPPSPEANPTGTTQTTSRRRSKRQKTSSEAPPQPTSRASTKRESRRKVNSDPAMSNNGYDNDKTAGNERPLTARSSSSSKYTEEKAAAPPAKSSAKRPSSRSNKKAAQETSPSTQTPPARRQRKRLSKKGSDQPQKSDEEPASKPPSRDSDDSSPPPPFPDNNDSADAASPGADDDPADPFSSALFGTARMSHTLRALSGMMSGMSSRFKDILANLRRNDSPGMQMVALEELSNLLLVSNEDNLSGHFAPDAYVKELVALMQPNPFTGEENPEIMLLACRCIANLMEAMRGSVAHVVYGGAVPVLCQKLLDIQYIDVAEQALSTLSKISVDFPASIVREGGLTACLQFLDFFATGTQRTAVTTAANCCRNIPHDSFAVIKDVMPILQNVLVSHDQKVVEQGCLCVTRVIDSFRHSPDKLEQLVDPALLKAVLGLLLPGTTNMIGANIHTEFLRVLAIVARASPNLSVELLKMKVVDTLYQILTGVSPPDETSDAASKLDSVVIMQALIHRPREQIYEALNVICELLPPAKFSKDPNLMDLDARHADGDATDSAHTTHSGRSSKRLELLETCKEATRRFAVILMPTLTDAYSSTVNLSVRQKVLTAHLKMLSNLEVSVIEEALRPVPYASFLASILSQEDHPSLVVAALQASELLFERLETIYQYQFHREGVIGEIQKLAGRTVSAPVEVLTTRSGRPITPNTNATSLTPTDDATMTEKPAQGTDGFTPVGQSAAGSDHDDNEEENDEDGDGDDDDDDAENEDEQGDDIEITEEQQMDDGDSDSSDEPLPPPTTTADDDLVIIQAKAFIEKHDNGTGQELKAKAVAIRSDLQSLASDIEKCYSATPAASGRDLFQRLSTYFDGNALESITSSELLDSGVIRVLVDVLSNDAASYETARADFLAAFMSATGISSALTVLIDKLQDLLSRAEHFEVLTVNNNASENNRSSSTSMLSRQLRLRLVADENSEIPKPYREMIVSIHAIATFKALDDYLRPRFSGPEKSSTDRRRELISHLANSRMAQLTGAVESGLFSPFGQELAALRAAADSRPPTRPSSQAKQDAEPPRTPATTTEAAITRRASLRRAQASTASTADLTTPPEPSTQSQEPKLECADEKPVDDDDEGMEDPGDATLEAFVDGLDDDMSDDDVPEPAAVNVEVASSGKVTARKEDGTRIVTPQPGTPVPGAGRPTSSDSPSLRSGSLRTAGRPSYAAALQSVPQDWHIEFSMDGNVIPNHTTIYRAVHHNRDAAQDASGRGVWSGLHTATFRKVKGPPPSASELAARNQDKVVADGELAPSLAGHPNTSSILVLMRLLHELNAGLFDVLGDTGVHVQPEPLASFINTKLTAKMNRQLEEPLIVASNCLPDWSEDLARGFPFLFPFETRHLFLQSTSFGYSRSITRWQSSQNDNDERRDRRRDDRPLMGRPQRQKVRISRGKILESAMKVLEMYGASPSILEVEYFNEVGTGLGPTLEFYSTVSKEFSKRKLKMWRENETTEGDFAFGKNGLFPAPMTEPMTRSNNGKKLLQLFSLMGKFVARSMLDARIIDISFNQTFFKLAANTSVPLTIGLLRTVDQDLANSINQLQEVADASAAILASKKTAAEKIKAYDALEIKGAKLDDLALDFTLPGHSNIELITDGANTAVTAYNVQKYIDCVLDMSLGQGVRKQIESFQAGFSEVFSYSSLQAFTPEELVMLFGRVEEDWSIETLMDSVKADHGFNMDSKSVRNLLQTMSELTPEGRRDFLQFVTGSPKLPIGGFKSLTPMFTVVCKPSEPPYASDDYLPSVMTCVNYLKLPDYSTQEVLKERLAIATREGQGAFHLS
jgi:E3 ubiquitin-protein ligase TRIP12